MARSTVTVNQLLADARMLVGALDYTRISNASMLTKYNLVLSKIYALLNGAKIRRYMAHAPLGTPSSFAADTTDATTYTSSTKRVSTALANNSFTGGLMMLSNVDDGKIYFARITSVSPSFYFVVDNGPTVDTNGLSFVALAPPSGLSHSIQEYRVDNIVRVHFPLSGGAPVVNEDVIESASSNPNFSAQSAITLTGTGGNSVVKVIAGSGTTNNGGFPVIFFEEKPKLATTVSDYVDLQPEYHAILVEELGRLTLMELGSEVPKALENPFLTLEAVSKTFQASRDAIAISADKS